MSDSEKPGGKGQDEKKRRPMNTLDAADLKARLGLKTRPQQLAVDESGKPKVQGAAHQDVNDARRSTEEGDASSGTTEEAFNLINQDFTPLPQALPDAEDMALQRAAGTGKLRLAPVLVSLLVVALVALFLGKILGASLEQRELRLGHALYAKTKLSYIQDAKTATGAKVLEKIQAMKDELGRAVKTIDSVLREEKPDLLKLEKPFQEMLPKFKRYRDEKTYIDPGRLMDDIMVLYQDDELLQAVEFAVKTRHLYDIIGSLVDEAVTLFRIERPAGPTQRVIHVKHEQRTVAELGTIPVSKGQWVSDTGKPDKVKLVDPKNSRLNREEWQQMVLVKGEKEAMQVPTSDVMSLDISPIYDEQASVIALLRVNRIERMVRKAHKVASQIRWSKVEQALRSRGNDSQP